MNVGQVIDKVHSRLLSGVRQQITTVTADYTAGSNTLQLGGNYTGAVTPGTVLSVDLEQFYVEGTTGSGNIVATVIPGFNGSTPANHTAGAQAIVNDRFPQFDILQAINDDLQDLSSSYNGLGQILYQDVTFNPTYQGYDLGPLFVSPGSTMLEVSYQIAPPVYTNPLIRKGDWRVIRNTNQPSVFPSGNGLIIYRSGYPGLPMHMQFLSPFNPVTSRNDDLTTVAGLPQSMYDLPALGAEILLIQPREVKRNFFEAQPDPRKAPEVPPGATLNSSKALEVQRQKRIDAEHDRIADAYPMAESF